MRILKHGDKFTGTFRGKFITGRISYSTSKYNRAKEIYLCQNYFQGKKCCEQFEYLYSYCLGSGELSFKYLKNKIPDLKITSDRKERIEQLKLKLC